MNKRAYEKEALLSVPELHINGTADSIFMPAVFPLYHVFETIHVVTSAIVVFLLNMELHVLQAYNTISY